MTEVNCTNILNTIACLDPAVNEYEVLLNNDIACLADVDNWLICCSEWASNTVRPDGSGNDSYACCTDRCSAA